MTDMNKKDWSKMGTAQANLNRIFSGDNRGDHLLAHVIADKAHISEKNIAKIHVSAQKAFDDVLAVSLATGETMLSEDDIQGIPELALPKTTVQQSISNKAAQHRSEALLKTEVAKGEHLNGTAKLVLLMGQLTALLGDMSLEKLKNRLSLFTDMRNALKAQGEKMSAELTDAQQVLQIATDEVEKQDALLENAVNSLQEKKDISTGKNARLEQAKKALKALTETPAAAKQDADKHALQRRQAEAELNNAKNEKIEADQAVSNANEKIRLLEDKLSAASSVAKEKLTISDNLLTEIKNLPGISPQLLQASSKEIVNNTARLSLLMATFSSLLSDNAIQKLKSDKELFQAIQEHRQLELEKQAEEQAAELRKAEELQKTMGCIGQILGYLILAVSVVAAVFTGGASLAFAAVGLALLATDKIMEAAGVESLSARIMDPVMKKIVEPMIKFFTDLFIKILKETGLDKVIGQEATDILAATLAAVAAVVVMVAAVVLLKAGGSAEIKAMSGPLARKLAGKLASTAVGKAVSNVGSKIAKSAVGKSVSQGGRQAANMARNISKSITKGTQKTLDKLNIKSDPALIGNKLKYANLALTGTNVATQSGLNIAANVSVKNALNAKADMILTEKELEMIREFLSLLVEAFERSLKTTQDIMTTMSSFEEDRHNTARAITRNLSGRRRA
ncbi:type III secretion system translocon subunit SctE [Candidatus Fukatsuia endosymbiont of Tuberolachnus salignus]|uniref:type III secretion system translocon subunit SctE n=1 Tax=Candidatus Fukatsuia endosymbiont of Tuberolachnus salignus TaxID=3077957 RepID=UPI00313DE37B